MTTIRQTLFAVGLARAVGCSEEPQLDPPVPDPGQPTPWSGEDQRPSLEHPFFDHVEGLDDLSLYATHVSGPVEDRPDHQHRGAFAVGNGLAFSLLGTADPVNTLHSMVGPVYERDGFFFGDLAMTLQVDGQPVAFQEEWIARVRGTAVVITRADTATHSLYTVDHAPHPAGTADLDVPPALVRLMLVTGLEGASGDVTVELDANRDPDEIDGMVVESIESDSRYRGFLPWGCELQADGNGWSIPLGTVGTGDDVRAALVLATGDSVDQLRETEALLDGASAEGWLADTLAWWAAYSGKGVQLTLGDPRVEDLYDGMRVGIRVQQSAAGAVCPMSQYTLMWLRDTIGPVRFYLRAGLHDEARAALDYLFLCAAVEGGLSNACGSGLHPDDLVEEPDWDSLGEFSGRLAAEGPSYVPLMYREFVAFTGDLEPVEQRWPYLRHAMTSQVVEEDGLQPFSGDETFRVAMSAGLGHDLSLAYEDLTWSANSAFLLAAAADWMALTATPAGHVEDVATFDDLAGEARTALADHFLQDGSHYAPFIFREGELAEERPYEDVNLKALWTGALAPDDPLALSNLAALEEAAGRDDGTVQTPLDPQYEDVLGYPVEEGICTGMVPGYYLYNLAVIGDPDGAAAFDALHAYADSAGQYGEYMLYDDLSAFQPIYDAAGGIGDYTARHRPWEGGINLDAMLVYLAGPLRLPGEDALLLRPHLPNSLPSMEIAHLVAGDAAGTLAVSRDGAVLTATFASEAGAPFDARFDLPVPLDAAAVASFDGPVPGTLTTLPGGEQAVRFDDVVVSAGETVTFTLEVAAEDP